MSSNKVLSWAALLRKLSADRRRRKKIVFTNGCFDLIHAGHLKVLESCKKHGDILVLGLNSDSSTRWLKGPKRPILKQNERAALLAGFSVVDYVTIFNDATPDKLIRLVKPDVLVKGGDWKVEDIVGSDVAKKVVRVPLVRGKSTTAIIEMIADRYR